MDAPDRSCRRRDRGALRTQRRAPRAALVALVALGLLTAACSRDAEPDDVPSAPAPAPRVPEPEQEEDVPRSPFTGLPVDAELLERPLLVTTVENSANARPQSGLDAADVVIEKLVEGGLTRFMVLLHSELPDLVGPVRSARPVDAQILSGLGTSGFAYSGARNQVQRLLAAAPTVNVVEGVDGFVRDRIRRAPHNLYLDPEVVLGVVTALGAAPIEGLGWEFSEEVPDGGLSCPVDAEGCEDPGASIVITMSPTFRTGWTYDESAGVYRRDQNGRPFPVTGDGEIGAANVVVLATRHYVEKYPETDATSTGAPAIVLRDGRRYEARWDKPTDSDLLRILTPEGQPFPLRPGATWLHLPSADRMPEVG